MIIHISEDRYYSILSTGFPMSSGLPHEAKYTQGDHEYHLLHGEQGRCAFCDEIYESVPAESAADLQVVKMFPNASTEELRTRIAANARAN